MKKRFQERLKKIQQINIAEQLKQVKRTRFKTCIVIAVIAAFLSSLLLTAGVYSNVQLKLSDYLYGGVTPLSNIAIVSIDDQSIQDIGRWPWERGNFTLLLDKISQAKVIAFDVAFFERSTEETDKKLAEAVAKAGNVVMPVEYIKFSYKDGTVYGDKVITPVTEITEAAAALGYINVITDQDGTTRAANLNIQGEYDHFTNAIVDQYFKKNPEKQTRFLINFVGKPGSYPYYSFSGILAGIYKPEEFKDKILLIGATATDLHDSYFVPTSYGKAMPGVEVHANTVQQLITGNNLRIAPAWITVITMFIISLGVALLSLYLSIWLASSIAIALLILYIFITIFTFNAGIILNIVHVASATIITYVGTVIYLYLSEKKSRKKVLGAFEKYVSKEVIKHIMENPERLKLGGDKREITIFFSDVRGFTSISEKLTPEELVHLLNEYLSEMTNLILKNNGVVDKYMGDAIMAFWNAPLDQPKHAELACKTCLEMEKRLKQLQKKWTEEGVPPIEIGIGLNTGNAVVGNMGSYERFDYTAMGDTINTGSRLEGLNKQYGTRILISESTKNKIDTKRFVVRKIDKVAVKGKKEPITIFELVSFKEDTKHWYFEVIKHFEKGLEHYFNQEWEEAKKEFGKADSVREGGDGASKAFIERCDYLKEHEPGKDWDGVWVMKTK